MVEHHAAHAASAYYPSPFEEATVLTLDRDGDFRCGARWRAPATNCSSKRICIIPIRWAISTAASRNCSDSTREPMSTKSSGFRPPMRRAVSAAFRRDSGNRATGPRIDRSFFDSDRLQPGRLQREVLLSASACEDGAEIPEALRAPLAAGLAARHRTTWCCAWPAPARNSVRGGRPGD